MTGPDRPAVAIIIPSRWGSRRLPGKPLALINGVTVLERVVRLARSAGHPASSILVATDDERIARQCAALEQRVVMTDPSIGSGSARVLAAARASGHHLAAVVNLQGDAPFVPVQAIQAVVAALRDGKEVVTPVVRLSWQSLDAMRDHKRGAPFSGTTCVRDEDGTALWFSKQVIPSLRHEKSLRDTTDRSPIFRHLGLYGYTLGALARFEAAPPAPYELLEDLEQLRFLALGIPVHTVEVNEPAIAMSGIDSIDDLDLAEALITRHGDPLAA